MTGGWTTSPGPTATSWPLSGLSPPSTSGGRGLRPLTRWVGTCPRVWPLPVVQKRRWWWECFVLIGGCGRHIGCARGGDIYPHLRVFSSRSSPRPVFLNGIGRYLDGGCRYLDSGDQHLCACGEECGNDVVDNPDIGRVVIIARQSLVPVRLRSTFIYKIYTSTCVASVVGKYICTPSLAVRVFCNDSI